MKVDVNGEQYTAVQKYCNRCGEFYPLTREFWYRDKRSVDGFRHCCKGCYSELPSVLRRRVPPANRRT